MPDIAPRREVLGVGFDPVTLEGAVETAFARMREHTGAYVCTPNPEIVMLARREPALRGAISGASLVLADGVGVVWAARRLGRPLPARVAGADFIEALLPRMTGRVFLLGGRPGVAERAGRALAARYPRLTVCGCLDGYFTEEAPVRAAIAAARPDLLLVCLGAPKQELFMAAHTDLPVGLMAGLGGVIDILAGTAARAPDAWRARGLEWLWRLLREPGRIKRMPALPRFVCAVLAQRIKQWRIKAD